MITITQSSAPESRRSRAAGFTLVEVLIAMSIGTMVLAGVLSTVLFIGRSGANAGNYADMESEARKALEQFAQDTRQASALTWNTSTSVTLTVNSASITYAYSDGNFTRTAGGSTETLLTGITTFSFMGYMINGSSVDLSDLSTSSKRTAASNVTKQIQISLEAERTTTTVATATNTVLSARYILRNKRVTA